MNSDNIWEITCRSRFITPLSIQNTMKVLFSYGALDVFIPASSGYELGISVLCKTDALKTIQAYLANLFPDAMILSQESSRSVLSRSIYCQQTVYGPVRCKESSGYGIIHKKLEYEDLASIAENQELSILEIKSKLPKN